MCPPTTTPRAGAPASLPVAEEMLAAALAPPPLAPEAGTAGPFAGSGCAVLGCAEAIIGDDVCDDDVCDGACAAGVSWTPLLEACDGVLALLAVPAGVTVLAADSVEV